jgi:putative sigma-54 modulation protein
MELNITSKNVELSPTVRRYVERKLGKLNRHLPNITNSKVELVEEQTKSPLQRYVAQVTINSGGTLLRGETRGEDLFSVIDKVAAVMDRQIKHYKGKLYKKGRRTSFARSNLNTVNERAPIERKVVKVKQFDIKPMSVEEAMDQMELLGHNFFLFFNADSNKVNLIYSRKDGNYGLIEPGAR